MTNTVRWPVLGLFLTMAHACGSSGSPGPVGEDLPQVYSSVVVAVSVGIGEKTRVVVDPRLRALRPDAPLLDYLPNVPGLAESFAEVNREAGRLTPDEGQSLGVPLFEADRFGRDVEGRDLDGWYSAVADHYGGDAVRIVRLTRPGFSTDRNTAAIYYGFGCGALCGEMRLAILERRDGVWRIVEDRLMLLS